MTAYNPVANGLDYDWPFREDQGLRSLFSQDGGTGDLRFVLFWLDIPCLCGHARVTLQPQLTSPLSQYEIAHPYDKWFQHGKNPEHRLAAPEWMRMRDLYALREWVERIHERARENRE